MIHELFLRMNHVGDCDEGEIHAVARPGCGIHRAGTRGAGTAADHVRADDEILVCIERFSGTDHGIPPAGLFIGFGIIARNMGVAGKRMFDENSVVGIRREGSVRFVTESDWSEELTALKLQPLVESKVLRGDLPDAVLEMFRFHRMQLPGLKNRTDQERDSPESALSASRYFSRVFATTSSGRAGAGGVLSQSRLSR